MTNSELSATFESFAPALAALLDQPNMPLIRLGTAAKFRRFRTLEPALVSVLDHPAPDSDQAAFYLVSTLDDDDAALASFVCETNGKRPTSSNVYGRIDLVITVPQFRSLGLAKFLVLAGILQLVLGLGPRMYSISCLAAHAAIEKILLDVGFEGDRREGQGFRHLSIRLDDENRDAIRQDIEQRLITAAKIAKYRMRQRKDSA